MQSCFSNLRFGLLCFRCATASLCCRGKQLWVASGSLPGVLMDFFFFLLSFSSLFFLDGAQRINSAWQVQRSERICFLKSCFFCLFYFSCLDVSGVLQQRQVHVGSVTIPRSSSGLSGREIPASLTGAKLHSEEAEACKVSQVRGNCVISLQKCMQWREYLLDACTEMIVAPMVVLQSFFEYVWLLSHIYLKEKCQKSIIIKNYAKNGFPKCFFCLKASDKFWIVMHLLTHLVDIRDSFFLYVV